MTAKLWFENARPVLDMPSEDTEAFMAEARRRAAGPVTEIPRISGGCWTCGEPYGDRYRGGDCVLCSVAAFLRLSMPKPDSAVDPAPKAEHHDRPAHAAHPAKPAQPHPTRRGRKKEAPEGQGGLF